MQKLCEQNASKIVKKNISTGGKVMSKIKVAYFLWDTIYTLIQCTCFLEPTMQIDLRYPWQKCRPGTYVDICGVSLERGIKRQ